MTAGDGKAVLYRPLLNDVEGTFDVVEKMLDHEHIVLGLSDGGAHVGMICDASQPTFMLQHWGRERTRGALMDLPRIVSAQSRETAEPVGLLDRGVIAPGYKADINVIDFAQLELEAPYVAYDLPMGGRRLLQRARGYDATLVSGVVISRHGEPTGSRRGSCRAASSGGNRRSGDRAETGACVDATTMRAW